MKEEHYYIPFIEEMCVNFICEINIPISINNKWQPPSYIEGKITSIFPKFEWEDYQNTSHTFGNNFKLDIRVKYLDEEDIKSFQFKTEVKNDYIYAQYGEEDLYIDYHIPTHFLKISSIDDTFFRGIINNKNELKKLLKQLQIN